MSPLFTLPNELLVMICDYLVPSAESLRTASSIASAHAAQRDLRNVYKTCRRLRSIAQGYLDRCPCVNIDPLATRTTKAQLGLLAKYRAAPLMARKVGFVSICIDETEALVPESSGATSTRRMTELLGFQPIPDRILDNLLGLLPNVTCLVWHEKAASCSRVGDMRRQFYLGRRLAHMKNLEALELTLVRDETNDPFGPNGVPAQLSAGNFDLPRLHTLRISANLLGWAVCASLQFRLPNVQHLLVDGDTHDETVNSLLSRFRHLKTFAWTMNCWRRTAVSFRFFPLAHKKTLQSLKIQASSFTSAIGFYPGAMFPPGMSPRMLCQFASLKVLELPLHLLLSHDDDSAQKFCFKSSFPSSLKTLRLGIYQGGYTEEVDQARLAYLLAECLVPKTSFLPLWTMVEPRLKVCRTYDELQVYWKSELDMVVKNLDYIAVPLQHLQNVDVLYPSSYDDRAMREPFMVAGLRRDVPIVSKKIGSM